MCPEGSSSSTRTYDGDAFPVAHDNLMIVQMQPQQKKRGRDTYLEHNHRIPPSSRASEAASVSHLLETRGQFARQDRWRHSVRMHPQRALNRWRQGTASSQSQHQGSCGQQRNVVAGSLAAAAHMLVTVFLATNAHTEPVTTHTLQQRSFHLVSAALAAQGLPVPHRPLRDIVSQRMPQRIR